MGSFRGMQSGTTSAETFVTFVVFEVEVLSVAQNNAFAG